MREKKRMVVCLVLALYMLLGMTVHASEDDTKGDVMIQNLSGNGGLLQCYKDGETELYFSEAIPKGVNTFTVEDLEQGSYYLEIKGGVALYEPMKFSVISSYDSEANVYTTDDVTIQAKYTMPGVSKLADRQSAKVGDRVTYTLQIDIPQYLDTEENKLFKISDMPSEGLEIDEDTIQFYACDAEYQKIGEALPVTDMIEIAMIPGLGMELTMTDYKAFCNLVGSSSVILEYQAVVNQYAHGGKSTENYATLTYEVDQILIVKPEEQGAQEALKPQVGKDFVTLLTCTPLGQNTHRLIVRGERK